MQLSAKLDAVFFDCDGVLADTERDGHRIAFNKGFEENNLRDNNGNLMEWGEEQYGKLCEIGGGKERMMGYWEQVCMYTFTGSLRPLTTSFTRTRSACPAYFFGFAFLCVHMFVSKCVSKRSRTHTRAKPRSHTLSLYLR